MALLASYGFGAGAGTTVADDSGNNHTATIAGTAFWSTGKSGSGFECASNRTDGSGALVPRTGLEPTTALTVMAWVKTTYSYSYQVAVAKGRTGASDSYALYPSYNTAQRPHFDLTTSAGSFTLDAGSAVLADTQWHHLCGTWDGTTAKFYVDGTQVATLPVSGTITYDTGKDLGLMTSHSFPDESFAGVVDDIRIYSHALTAGEVVTDMNTAVGGGATLTVNAGVDQTIYTGQSATLTATASGGSGAKTYAWTKVSGPSGTFSAASSASTGFTPSAAGTFNLRCTVTDTSGSAFDDVQVIVANVTSSASVAAVTNSTGWTVEPSGTALAALSDTSGSTFVRSSNNPTGQVLEVQLTPINAPGAGVDLVVQVACDAITAGSASCTAQLYQGATLRSTVSGLAVAAGNNANPVSNVLSVAFPAADVANVTSWTTGLIVKLAFTAAV